MKTIKTKITLLVALFMLSCLNVNAKENLLKNNTVEKSNLKIGAKPNLKKSTAPIDVNFGELIDGRYQIYWSTNSGVVCCFNTVLEAKNAYPNKNLKYVTEGRMGKVYHGMANGSIGNNIANVHIAFREENSTVTHYAHTGSHGGYRMALLPGRYIVTVKHKGYRHFNTSCVQLNNKYNTLNIALQKLSNKSSNQESNGMIAVFDKKTGELKDIIDLEKSNKLEKDPNSIFVYTTQEAHKKGLILILHLDQFIPGDEFPGEEFISVNQYTPGDQFTVNSSKYRVLSKTNELLSIVLY